MYNPLPISEASLIADDLLDDIKDANMRAKIVLGWHIVSQYHGAAAATKAAQDWKRIHVYREVPEDLPTFGPSTSSILPAKLLVELGWLPSMTQARKVVESGGFSVNGTKIVDHKTEVNLMDGDVIKFGKQKMVRIKSQN